MKQFLLFAAAAVIAGAAMAQNEQIHVFRNDKTFNSYKGADVESITYSGGTDGYTKMILTDAANKTTTIDMSVVDSVVVRSTGLPEIHVTLTEHPELKDLPKGYSSALNDGIYYTKSTVHPATLYIDGNGMIDDLEEQTVEFRGRGNSTWNMAKTPYRFKMGSKKSIGGMKKAKTFALIANYIDCTLMRNTVALWVANYLGLPYSNHCVPVVVYFNGNYKGQYMMTEKIGIGGGSVDIDELKGMLFELDSNYDEDYRFTFNLNNYTTAQPYGSPLSNQQVLPVMVKDPDLTEVTVELGVSADEYFATWKSDFANMAKAVMSTPTSGSLKDYLDLESVVRYFIVNSVANNHEMKHPKSLYIHKDSLGGVYKFGPVWDFDWAFTYDGNEYASATVPLVSGNGDCGGYAFLKKLFQNEELRKLYKERWDEFVTTGYPEMLSYMENYATTIEPSAKENGLLWTGDSSRNTVSTFEFRKNYETLKAWIQQRVDYCNSHKNYGLFE